MQIIINTAEELSTNDREVLAKLIGLATVQAVEEGLGQRLQREAAERAAADKKAAAETVPVEEPAAQPKRTRGKPKPAPEPEPTPEPEPEPEPEPVAEPEEDLLGDSPEPVTREQAVARATEVLNAGNRDKVKNALSVVGAKRVGEVKDADLAAFVAALA